MTSNITNMMLKNCNPANSFALPPSKLRTLQNGCSKHVPSHLTLVVPSERWNRGRPFAHFYWKRMRLAWSLWFGGLSA